MTAQVALNKSSLLPKIQM